MTDITAIIKKQEADLVRITAERDAAIKDIEAMMSDADEPLCGYCANAATAIRCGTKWRGCNAKWRGVADD